jgi:hypothetical protein
MQIPPNNNNNNNNNNNRGQRFHRGNPVITPNPNSPRNHIGQRVPQLVVHNNPAIIPSSRVRILRLRSGNRAILLVTDREPVPIRRIRIRLRPEGTVRNDQAEARNARAEARNARAIAREARNARAEAAPVQQANIPQNILLPLANELGNRRQAPAPLRPRNLPKEHQQ